MKTLKPGLISLLFVLFSMLAIAQIPNYIYYVPLPETQINTSYRVLDPSLGTVFHTVISITPSESNMIIFYDQWEDGYENNIGSPTQASTQIWGDNNPANGIPPGYATDMLVAGKPIVLQNDINISSVGSTIYFDGRDKIAATRSIALSRSTWALNPGSVLTDAVEFMNTKTWGTFFYIPIGQNTPSDLAFNYVSLEVQASQNGTVVNIDIDGNGTTDISTVINEGQSYQVNGGILQGATVTTTKPVQVMLITGRIGATYECRWYNIYPFALWEKSCYTPVGTTNINGRSDVYIFNGQPGALTVFYKTNGSNGSFSIPTKGVYRFQMPLLTSAHFYAEQPFFAIGEVDANATDNQSWDWGYSLYPEGLLTNSLYNGWGAGAAGIPIPGNGNPVWVGAASESKNTTIYVDLDGNPLTGAHTDINGNKYDYSLVLLPLGMVTIYNPSFDQTGMHVYTVDGAKIFGAWGEDPSVAPPGNPYIDAGNTIPPDPSLIFSKTAIISSDANNNGLADAGDIITYTLYLHNQTLLPYTSVTIVDAPLDSHTTYVLNSTKFNNTPIPDDVSGTPYPLDGSGYTISPFIAAAFDSITFSVTVNGPINYSKVNNDATATTDFGQVIHAHADVLTNYNATPCTIAFTNSVGTTVNTYNENAVIYVKVTDADHNINPAEIDSVLVTITNTTTGEIETIYLHETNVNTGDFRGSIPSSKNAGAGNNNGILNAEAGNLISVNYTDLIFGGACNTTATITGPAFRKPLYLTDSLGGHGLDRVLPTKPTATNSIALGTITTLIIGTGTTTPAVGTTGTSGGTLTFTHAANTGTDRLLIVTIGIGSSTDNTGTAGAVASVTFAGQAMTLVGTQLAQVGGSPSNPGARIYIYSLMDDPSTSYVMPTSGSIIITATADQIIEAGATTFTNVDQTTPYGSFASNASSGSTAVSVGVASNTGEVVVSVAGSDWGNIASSLTTNPSQTELWNYSGSSYPYEASAASTKPGASGTVTSNYTSQNDNPPQEWAAGAISLVPATAIFNSSLTFIQNPDMCSSLTLPVGGPVKVKLWLTGITGSMPVNPAMNVVLKNNGTTFLTLTNPTFTDNSGTANDTLVFTGAINGSPVTILAATALSAVITTTQTNVSFQVSYDALAMPSFIRLPAGNVIHITSMNIYDAAYNGGIIITQGLNGQTIYVRTTVTDPFGASDINGITLRITDPNNNFTDVVMTQVGTVTCGKVYQYVWTTGPVQGTYNLRSIAAEGKELQAGQPAVADTAYTSIVLHFEETGTPCNLEFTATSNGVATTSYPGPPPSPTIYVRLTDFDRNTHPTSLDTAHVTLTSSSGDLEKILVTETGINTGVFIGSIATSTTPSGNNSGVLYALSGATILGSYTDPTQPADICNISAIITTLTPQVAILKSRILPPNGIAIIGDTVRWEITVSNPGPTSLNTLKVRDNYPPGCLTYNFAHPAPSIVNADSLVWNTSDLGGPLASGNSINIIVTFVANTGCGPIVNTVRVSAVDQNGVNTSSGPVTSPVTINNPQLSISKTRTSPINTTIYVGDPITYTITVTNTGNTVAQVVPVSDNYSDYNLTYNSSLPVADFHAAGLVVWNNIGPINVGNSKTVTVNYIAKNGNLGLFVVNTASVNFATDINGSPIPNVYDTANSLIHYRPVAIDDHNITLENTPVSGQVLTNDYDLDGDVLTVTVQTNAATSQGGTVTVNADGTYTYTPPPGFTGVDTFVYQVCDPTGACATATVTITVVPCYNPPSQPGNIIKN